MKRNTIIFFTIGGLLLLALLGYGVYSGFQPSKYDAFATCVKDSGAKFYGAFWCPHCQDQKTMFKQSAKLLPYIECSTPDGQGQTQICKDANVTGYPTWEFADGTRVNGVAQFATLSEKTSCVLPS